MMNPRNRLEPPPRRGQWTVEQVRDLGLTTDVATAASILGIGRATAYDLIKRGEFPVPVLRYSNRIVIPVEPLLRLMHAPGDA